MFAMLCCCLVSCETSGISTGIYKHTYIFQMAQVAVSDHPDDIIDINPDPSQDVFGIQEDQQPEPELVEPLPAELLPVETPPVVQKERSKKRKEVRSLEAKRRRRKLYRQKLAMKKRIEQVSKICVQNV